MTSTKEEAPQKVAMQEETFHEGPMSLLTKALKGNQEVLVNCRNNRKILGRVRAFDRHMNMVLEEVCEIWTEKPRANKGKKAQPRNRERFFNKLFLRGDSVILVVSNPK